MRLLLRGDGLTGARASVSGSGVRLGRPKVAGGGRYVFVDLHLDPAAAPGPRRIVLETPSGTASVRFDVFEAPSPSGRAGVGPDDILYLILPDRFADGDPGNNAPPGTVDLHDPSRPRHYHGGDFAGVRRRLPYLRDLGVSALWMTPIAANAPTAHPTLVYDGEPAIDYHGYAAVDLYRVSPHFGTLAELRALVEDAHRHGIKVVQDQVANHVGPLHPWVDHPPTRTWIHPKRPCAFRPVDLLSPHTDPAIRARTLDGWFAGILPDLNQDDPECARYLIQNALWWVAVGGFDGIRQDTAPYVPRAFWRDWCAALRREFPWLSLLGEVNFADPALVAFWQGGRRGWDGIDPGFDQAYDFPLQAALHGAFVRGAPLATLADALAHDPLYPDPSRLVTFVGLHDLPRFAQDAPAWALPLAAAFVLGSRGIPLWYYGDEIGMAGGEDPDNRRHFPGGFPGDARDAFTEAGRTASEQALFAAVRFLMRLRRESAALRRGATRFVDVAPDRLAWVRGTGDGAALVAMHRGTRPATFALAGLGRFSLPPRAAGVWEKRGGSWRPRGIVDLHGVHGASD